jgi:large-conductance mechanosensitive channel
LIGIALFIPSYQPLAAFYKLELFFPAMLLVIGGRYLTFNTIYGNRLYRVFSGFLVASSAALAIINAPVYLGGFVGGAIEYIFAFAIFLQAKKSNKLSQQDASGGAA